MLKSKINISNKVTAFNGATVAVASVFAYSIIIMIYAIIRSSATIYSIMPMGERNSILWANGISIAYSVAVFSVILALISSLTGAIAAVILKNFLLYFNPQFNFRNAVLISSITALALLILMYFSLYALLKDWMTFGFAETFTFWFLFPAAIFFGVCIIGGSKLNKCLNTGSVEVNNNINKI
jgi:hypothetical protein